jgi:hypothetical protein
MNASSGCASGSDGHVEPDEESDGGFDQELEDFLGDLESSLDDIQTQGEFGFQETQQYVPFPGLQVGNQAIPLPLVPRDAEIIKSRCQQAPFGRKDETVVDLSVRKTWELNSDQSTLSNPTWQEYIANTIDRLKGALGM